MVDVQRVQLPGFGILHSFVSGDGGKIGVLAHHSGDSDIIAYSHAEDESDSKKISVRLDEDEARTLAELLGGTRITESLSMLDITAGISIDWFMVDSGHHIAGKMIGDVSSRDVAGLVVLAVVRGASVSASPPDDFVFVPGDTLLAAGTPEIIMKAFTFYRSGEQPDTPSGS